MHMFFFVFFSEVFAVKFGFLEVLLILRQLPALVDSRGGYSVNCMADGPFLLIVNQFGTLIRSTRPSLL